jgi:predicted NBD/HSP70 family sugar kinase
LAPLTRNTDQIVDLLASNPGGLTRKDLRERSGLSMPTVLAVIEELKRDGRIHETTPPRTSGRPGRRGSQLMLSEALGHVVGIDQGHHHVVAALATSGGHILRRTPVHETDIVGRGPQSLTDIAELVGPLLKGHASPTDVRAIAIGLPAPVRDASVALPQFLQSWAGTNVEEGVRAALPNGWPRDLPIAVENDANLGACGERRYGVARDVDDFVYVKVSSGIGLGVYLNGELYRGAHGAAGEFGHVTTSADAENRIEGRLTKLPQECRACGKLNCLENLASCRAILAQLRDANPGTYRATTDIGNVIDSALAGDALSRLAIHNAGIRIGYAISDLLRVLDPQLVVVGGLLARAEGLLSDPIHLALDQAAVATYGIQVEFVPKDLVYDSEVNGAIARACELARSAA